MNDRDDLGELLQRIAATVGDPPEHGLDRVDARRRRRTRHRRGAVAAAVALAVSAVGVVPWLTGLGEGTNVATGRPEGDEIETSLPDYVQVNCGPEGLSIPIASIQTQRDGMHLRIHNALPHETAVWVRGGEGWDSGRVVVPPGDRQIEQAVPPGDVTVGCDAPAEPRELSVILNDERHNYDKAELSCPDDERAPPLPPGTFESTNSTLQAGTLSMGDLWRDGDQVRAATGYDEDEYARSKTRRVGIERDGELVAFVYLHDDSPSDEELAAAPWAGYVKIEYCLEMGEDGSTADTTTTSVTSPPPS